MLGNYLQDSDVLNKPNKGRDTDFEGNSSLVPMYGDILTFMTHAQLGTE